MKPYVASISSTIAEQYFPRHVGIGYISYMLKMCHNDNLAYDLFLNVDL